MSTTINILWTGGWDSTFRVLDAVAKGCAIQPHYIVDRGRSSHAIEFLTVGRITQKVIERYPNAQIAWPRLIDGADIPADPDITAAFTRLASQSYLGGQYDWLPRYAVANKIDGLELCIHQQDKAHAFVSQEAKRVTTDNDSCYIVPNSGSDISTIFSHFRFPILEMTKTDMEEAAKQRGFGDIMEMTWFCHSPRDGKPCGLCNPCIYTAQEGMAERLPQEALERQRSWPRLLKRQVKKSGLAAFHSARELGRRISKN